MLYVLISHTSKHFYLFQEMDDPQHSVMILMAIYANVALKEFSQSHTDQVTSAYNKNKKLVVCLQP